MRAADSPGAFPCQLLDERQDGILPQRHPSDADKSCPEGATRVCPLWSESKLRATAEPRWTVAHSLLARDS